MEVAVRSHQNLPSAPFIIKSVEAIDHQSTMSTKLCSACGTKSDTVKKSTACKCVWYCDKECQNKHRKEHRKDCKRIKKELEKRGGKLDLGTEEDIGPIGKLPPREECPVCMRALPLHPMLHAYYACCGKTLCCGCYHQHWMKSGEQRTCAFCRTVAPKTDEEILARLRKRVELKDPDALLNSAMDYCFGRLGLPVDQAKCIDILRESAGLGCPDAQFNLGNFHDRGEMGLEQKEELTLKYWEEAARGGHLISRHKLGHKKLATGDFVAAMKHWRLSASGGYRDSVEPLIQSFECGVLKHGDLAKTLQDMYAARAEMKSDGRDEFIAYLKRTGKYDEEYDL